MKPTEKRVSPFSHNTLMLLLVCMVFFWGLNWPSMKIVITYMSAWYYVFLRMGLGALAVAVYITLTKQWQWPTRRAMPLILGVGLLQMTVCNGLMVGALKYIDASRGVILSYSTPIWVAPAAILIFKEKYNATKLIGIMLGFAGVILLFNPFTFDWNNQPALVASFLLLFASATWAASILLLRQYRTGFPVITLTFWQLMVPFVLLSFPSFLWGHAGSVHWDWKLAGLVLYGGVIATGFSFVAVIIVSKYLASTTTSLVLLGVPVAGMLLSALLLGEHIGIDKMLAMFCVVVGVSLVLRADKQLRVAEQSHAQLET